MSLGFGLRNKRPKRSNSSKLRQDRQAALYSSAMLAGVKNFCTQYYIARDENMAVKMSDATHERFYDVEIA